MKNSTTYTYPGSATVTLSTFRPEAGAPEHHAVITPAGARPFADQLRAVTEALERLKDTLGAEAKPVFMRYFLSDSANQSELLPAAEPWCSVSVVGQAPLVSDGGFMPKLALWVWFMEDVTTGLLDDGMTFARSRDGVCRYFAGTMAVPEADSHEATTELLESYAEALRNIGATLEANCVRTWFFVRDVDVNYAGVVQGRNEVFDREGLTAAGHSIASTGIGSLPARPEIAVTLDTYAMTGLTPGAISFINGASHLNPTREYGVAFERATAIDLPDRRQVLVSGTASIDNRGGIVWPGDIVRQTERMCENIEVLLAEAACSPADMLQAIVYLRDIADAPVVESIIAARYPQLPHIVVHGAVCRPGWLVEMECIAAR